MVSQGKDEFLNRKDPKRSAIEFALGIFVHSALFSAIMGGGKDSIFCV